MTETSTEVRVVHKSVAKIIPFASPYPKRYAMQGVQVGPLGAVATNGAALAWLKPVGGQMPAVEAIYDAKGLKKALQAKHVPGGPIPLANYRAGFRDVSSSPLGPTGLMPRQGVEILKGPFVLWKDMVDQECAQHPPVLMSEDWLPVCAAALAYGAESIGIRAKSTGIRAPHGSATFNTPPLGIPEDYTIHLNPALLAKCIKAFGTDVIEVRFPRATRGCVLDPVRFSSPLHADGGPLLVLLMPVTVQS
jgi:hypothetical protein